MNRKTIAIGVGATVAALVVGAVVVWPHGSTDAPAAAAPPSVQYNGDTPPDPNVLAGVIPPDVTWVLSNQVAVPISPTAGPTRISPEGIRSGFAHTPSGALMAAANWAAADAQRYTAPGPATIAVIDQRMLPWPGHDQAKASAVNEAAHPSNNPMTLQIAGFRFLAYDGDHATILIAQHITSPANAPNPGYGPWLNLVWLDNDWWIVPAIDGHGEIGTPITWPLVTPDWTNWAGVS